jgi:hypothetical protein
MRVSGSMTLSVRASAAAATLVAALRSGVFVLLSTGEIDHVETAPAAVFALLGGRGA